MTTVNSSPQTVEFSGAGASRWSPTSGTAAHTRRPERPTILMLHGGGQNRFSWKNTGQILADDGFHVIALDSRGHGDSDRAPNADYDVETLCADVMRVLECDRPAGGHHRCQHGRVDRHPRRRPRRPDQGDQIGARRRRAPIREGRQRPHPRFHDERPATVSRRWSRRPTPSPPTSRIARSRAARRA